MFIYILMESKNDAPLSRAGESSWISSARETMRLWMYSRLERGLAAALAAFEFIRHTLSGSEISEIQSASGKARHLRARRENEVCSHGKS